MEYKGTNYYKTKKALDEKIEVLQKEVDKAIKVKGMTLIPLDRLPYYSHEVLILNFDAIYKAGVKDAVEVFREMGEELDDNNQF